MDLCLHRWYHCTAIQTAATTTAQFWNKPIVRRETTEGIYNGRKPEIGGAIKMNLNHGALYTVERHQ